MKKIFLITILSGFVVGDERPKNDDGIEEFKQNPLVEQANQIILDANRKFSEERRKLEASYRSQLAEALRLVDSAEIFLLDFEPIPRPGGGNLSQSVKYYGNDVDGFSPEPHLYIPSYDAYSKILKQKKVKAESLTELVDSVIDVFKEPSGLPGPLCHYPIHGIRLSIGKEVYFETSLCWHCGNYFIRMPGAWGGMWVNFSGKKLEVFLKKEMPIPKSEIERFEEEFKK